MHFYSSVLSIPENLPVAFDDYAAPDEGCVVCDETAVYHPRNPKDNPLDGIISGHLETFLSRQRERERHSRLLWNENEEDSSTAVCWPMVLMSKEKSQRDAFACE
jgi:hypothetical protein